MSKCALEKHNIPVADASPLNKYVGNSLRILAL